MASTRPASRYTSFDSTSSPSSSSSLPSTSKKPLSALKRLLPGHSASSRQRRQSTTPPSAAPSSCALSKCNKEQNFGSMVKKFMDKKQRPGPDSKLTLVVPTSDLLKEELKKVGGAVDKGSKFSGLQRRLFQKAAAGSGGKVGAGEGKAQTKKVKALLCEGKENTRTLGMVLRSERDLLNRNKEYEQEIAQLRSLIDQRNREVKNLENLCLKQQEEIKALKEAILFPGVMNTQLQQHLARQGAEVKQENLLIPDLQQQVSSLTGQLQCLAQDLAKVKADKYATRSYCSGTIGSPQTMSYDREALYSQEFSSEDPTVYCSIDEMFVKDLNPCLTPDNVRTKSKEYEGFAGHGSAHRGLFGSTATS